jgi:hypothetical protein
MSWYGWLALGVALAGYLPTWRLLFRYFAFEFSDEPDWEDVGFSLFFAAFFALGWPLLALGWLISRADAPRFVRRVAGESRVEKQARHERELRDRENRIARMEKELGIT